MKKNLQPNRLSNIVEKSAYPFRKLKKQYKKIICLDQIAQPLILKHTGVHANVVNYQSSHLCLRVANQSAANHLYYLKAIILQTLQEEALFADIEGLSVTISDTKITQNKQMAIKTKPITEVSRERIHQLAEKNIKNTQLSLALKQLADKKNK